MADSPYPDFGDLVLNSIDPARVASSLEAGSRQGKQYDPMELQLYAEAMQAAGQVPSFTDNPNASGYLVPTTVGTSRVAPEIDSNDPFTAFKEINARAIEIANAEIEELSSFQQSVYAPVMQVQQQINYLLQQQAAGLDSPELRMQLQRLGAQYQGLAAGVDMQAKIGQSQIEAKYARDKNILAGQMKLLEQTMERQKDSAISKYFQTKDPEILAAYMDITGVGDPVRAAKQLESGQRSKDIAALATEWANPGTAPASIYDVPKDYREAWIRRQSRLKGLDGEKAQEVGTAVNNIGRFAENQVNVWTSAQPKDISEMLSDNNPGVQQRGQLLQTYNTSSSDKTKAQIERELYQIALLQATSQQTQAVYSDPTKLAEYALPDLDPNKLVGDKILEATGRLIASNPEAVRGKAIPILMTEALIGLQNDPSMDIDIDDARNTIISMMGQLGAKIDNKFAPFGYGVDPQYLQVWQADIDKAMYRLKQRLVIDQLNTPQNDPFGTAPIGTMGP